MAADEHPEGMPPLPIHSTTYP